MTVRRSRSRRRIVLRSHGAILASTGARRPRPTRHVTCPPSGGSRHSRRSDARTPTMSAGNGLLEAERLAGDGCEKPSSAAWSMSRGAGRSRPGSGERRPARRGAGALPRWWTDLMCAARLGARIHERRAAELLERSEWRHRLAPELPVSVEPRRPSPRSETSASEACALRTPCAIPSARWTASALAAARARASQRWAGGEKTMRPEVALSRRCTTPSAQRSSHGRATLRRTTALADPGVALVLGRELSRPGGFHHDSAGRRTR